MKKLAIIAAVLMLIPIAALARMNSMSDDDMGVLRGQVGITIDFQTCLTNSYLAVTDSDGFSISGLTATNGGATTLRLFSIYGTGGLGTNMDIDGLDIDAGSTGTTSYVLVGLPRIRGTIDVQSVAVGTTANSGDSLGQVTWGNIDFAETDLTISTHGAP